MEDKLLQLYFEGRTTEEQTKRVTSWLNSDEEHMKYYLQLCSLQEFAIWNDISSTSEKKERLFLEYGWKFVKIAAIFILGFLLSYQLSNNQKTEPSMQEVNVPAGQNAQVLLADGSKVWLNAGSSLRFPSQFSDNVRKVDLKGEGYFEVKANKEKPFIVSTSKYAIKALGTSFNVNAYEQSSCFETALLAGKVEIDNLSGKKILQLTPNNRAVLNKDCLIVEEIKEHEYFLWREGVIYFNDPLYKIFEKLELCFDVRIDVKKKQILKNTHHSIGKFRTRDGLEHILKVLQLNNKFLFKKDDEKNLITIY